MLDSFFQECRRQGEILVLEGSITVKEIEDPQCNILPAYCIYLGLLRSAKANSPGLIMCK